MRRTHTTSALGAEILPVSKKPVGCFVRYAAQVFESAICVLLISLIVIIICYLFPTFSASSVYSLLAFLSRLRAGSSLTEIISSDAVLIIAIITLVTQLALLVLTCFVERSKERGGPGKQIFGLIVISAESQPLQMNQALLRGTLKRLPLTLLSFSIIFGRVISNALGNFDYFFIIIALCTSLVLAAITITTIFSFTNKRRLLPHDFLSNSTVVYRNKSSLPRLVACLALSFCLIAPIVSAPLVISELELIAIMRFLNFPVYKTLEERGIYFSRNDSIRSQHYKDMVRSLEGNDEQELPLLFSDLRQGLVQNSFNQGKILWDQGSKTATILFTEPSKTPEGGEQPASKITLTFADKNPCKMDSVQQIQVQIFEKKGAADLFSIRPPIDTLLSKKETPDLGVTHQECYKVDKQDVLLLEISNIELNNPSSQLDLSVFTAVEN